MLRAGKLSKSTTKDLTWFCNLEKCYDAGNGVYVTKDYCIIVLEDCCLTWKHADMLNSDICKTYFQAHEEADAHKKFLQNIFESKEKTEELICRILSM
ncbi:MAG: hypothetical protein CVU60_17475 [Deltaproteobacteria bacterium HGW-Deltaproteobacteria-18]|jgi:hypothetical protein|nr:MAG: hypothetical protein CVU60_17475 [Deltaproteobacteria bacterium HGW-Deltaproteobacteria-18]